MIQDHHCKMHRHKRNRVAVEEIKIQAETDITEITTWNTEIDNKLAESDKVVEELRTWLDQRRKEKDNVAREEQIQFETMLFKTRMEFETKLASAKVETLTINKEGNLQGESQQSTLAKLPKLVISKFGGDFQDWQRFWGQFTETVDKTNMPAITKFTYLCELLDPNIKHVIDSLPFTTKGYNRAKSILKDRYGKESEIIKSYVKDIMDLPYIHGANPKKIRDFSERLNHCMQALQTMNRLSQVNGNVAMTLDKLPGIRGDLVRTDPDWERWTYVQLSEAVRQWVKRNPVDQSRTDRDKDRQIKSFHAKSRECVYCGDVTHKAGNCTKITSVTERKQILARKRLCFNCAIGTHRAAECSSKGSCQNCGKRHHTSICDTAKVEGKEQVMTTNQSSESVLPVIVIKVNGVKCRALIDTGSGSSYISAKLIEVVKAKPISTQTRQVEMLMSSKSVRMDIYELNTESVDGQYQMPVKFIKVNKPELLTIENPNYADLIRDNAHLSEVIIADKDTKSQLPVHVIFGSGEYARIKTETKLCVRKEETEARATKELLNVVNVKEDADEFDRSLERLNLRRACRVGVWIKRSIHNCRNNDKRSGPITTEEVIRERDWWIRRVQQRVQKEPHYPNLKTNNYAVVDAIDMISDTRDTLPPRQLYRTAI
ncbi:Pol poly [Paramuricea clavata]|uniref:Pol poly n=1 Tax=Paramuricea clavata TaxID=317549 RepID=A0A7D9DEA7_PARCT|nr:Pol poly [Paramuricea clavata]